MLDTLDHVIPPSIVCTNMPNLGEPVAVAQTAQPSVLEINHKSLTNPGTTEAVQVNPLSVVLYTSLPDAIHPVNESIKYMLV